MNWEFLIRKKWIFSQRAKVLMEQRWRTSLLGFIGALLLESSVKDGFKNALQLDKDTHASKNLKSQSGFFRLFTFFLPFIFPFIGCFLFLSLEKSFKRNFSKS